MEYFYNLLFYFAIYSFALPAGAERLSLQLFGTESL